MACRKCKRGIGRKELKAFGGLCQECATLASEDRRVVQDFANSFSGRGKPGFVRLMQLGSFLSPMQDQAAVNWHNNICMVIDTMIGSGRHAQLLDKVADAVIELVQVEE